MHGVLKVITNAEIVVVVVLLLRALPTAITDVSLPYSRQSAINHCPLPNANGEFHVIILHFQSCGLRGVVSDSAYCFAPRAW